MNKELADLLFPTITKTKEDYEKIYPPRNLCENAIVTRFGPSPTGFVHMGSLFASFFASTIAHQTNGVFFLRIEDTDQKREVEDGISGIIRDLNAFECKIDEGPTIGGDYGPYIQSERREIYQAMAKYLVEQGAAYPCFCTEQELKDIRMLQEANKLRIGYYGSFARDRNLTLDEIKERLSKNEPYVIRLKSPGNFDKRIEVKDCIKGEISFPENDIDIVILKSDGLPTYHFAHAVDDHFMRTTHVIRGDEWVSSLPVHIQLFQVLSWKAPKYAHLAPLTKKDGTTVRKLSKRHDPECSIRFYQEQGIPTDVIKLYLSTIANTNFEEWYINNADKSFNDFKFDFKKMSVGGSLFDVEKLYSISRTYFSRKSAIDVYQETVQYAKEFDPEFASILEKNKEYSVSVLNIEREVKKPRKDIASYSDVKQQVWYMFDELFDKCDNLYCDLEREKYHDVAILNKYMESYYDENDNNETWFSKMKEFASTVGYAKEVKEYKATPDAYKGHVGDICQMLRVAVTTKTMTPDLCAILKLLGKERINKRIHLFQEILKSK